MATFQPVIDPLYVFRDSQSLDGSIVTLPAGVDLAEGTILACSSTGTAIKCTAALVPIGVARYSVYAGDMVAVENDCVIENMTPTSLALTPGTRVYTAANGAISATATGATAIGYALTANKAKVSL